MTWIPRKLLLLILILIIAGCGGSSSAINNPNIVFNSPVATVIGAGTTLQLQATVSGSSNTAVLWYVNNIPGGNSTVGTITQQGLYTAPNTPTSGRSVTIQAAPQAYPTISTSIMIFISFANASLTGNYIFSLQGTENGGPWAVTGSFTADANGNISNGVEDINGPAGISTALPFNGSYLINANGQGSATFTSAQGSFSIGLTLNNQGQAAVMRIDPGTVATGAFYPQLSTALSVTSLNAPYVFNFSGAVQSGAYLNVIGYFNTNGSTTLSYAEEELNNGGTTAYQQFSGSYSIGSNARGTATFTDTTGTRTYSFYIVSPVQFQIIEIDTLGHLSGTVFLQQSVLPTTFLAGGYVYYIAGTNGTADYGAAGGFFTNATTIGIIDAGTNDINQAGSIATNSTLTGSFTNASYGRGTITLTGSSGTNNYVFYYISPGAGFLLTTDNGINASGEFFSQSGGYSIASLSGYYSLSQSSPVNSTSHSAEVGLLYLNGVGATAGYANVNDNGTSSGQLSVTGTYTITTGSASSVTRGTATLITSAGLTTNYAFYTITNLSVIMLGESGLPVVAMLVGQ